MTSGTPIDLEYLLDYAETTEQLIELGRNLEAPAKNNEDATVAHAIAREWLRVRNKVGANVPLQPNHVQQERSEERRVGKECLE